MLKRATASAAVLALGLLGVAHAPASAQDEGRVDLSTWNNEQLYAAWRAEELIDEAEVYGAAGDHIGDVEDIIVGPDDRIRSVVVETGGFLDIGDRHLAVPWDQVEIVSYDRVNIPVTEETVDEFDIYADVDDKPVGPRAWRVSELVNDYAYLQGGVRYGYVDDVLFNSDGEIVSVVTQPATGAYGYGTYYAWPYYGWNYGWDPGQPRYDLGYTPEELEAAGVEPFVYDEMENSAVTRSN